MAHRHKATGESKTYGWTTCVSPYTCPSQRAHGGVVHVETCSCGAVKRTEANGTGAHSSGWYVPDYGTDTAVRA